jgi:hypothetical protein
VSTGSVVSVAAPEYVPTDTDDDARVYRSPLRPAGSWSADRPGDLGPGQPRGDGFGSQGPDQGFALTIAQGFRDRLSLAPGEHADDAIAGAAAVATKRSSWFGRAPVVHDVTIGFTVWGFLDAEPDPELVAERRRRFAEVAHPHHYAVRRSIADAVADDVLQRTADQIEADHRSDWRSLLDLDAD